MERETVQEALMTWPHILNNLAMIALFASALLGVPFFGRMLRWRALAWVGKISYSMFLFHQIIIVVIHVRFQIPLQNWVVQHGGSLTMWAVFSGWVAALLAACVIVAYLGYRYIESPFLRYKPR